MIIPGLACHLARDQITRSLEVEHKNLCLQK